MRPEILKSSSVERLRIGIIAQVANANSKLTSTVRALVDTAVFWRKLRGRQRKIGFTPEEVKMAQLIVQWAELEKRLAEFEERFALYKPDPALRRTRSRLTGRYTPVRTLGLIGSLVES